MIAATRSKNNKKIHFYWTAIFFAATTHFKTTQKFCSKVSSPENAKEIAAISHSKTKQKFCNLQKKDCYNKLKTTEKFCNKFLFFWTAKNCNKLKITKKFCNKILCNNSATQIPILLNCKNCNKLKNNTKFYNKIFSNNSAKNSSSSELQRLQQTPKINTKFCKFFLKKFSNSATKFCTQQIAHLCLYIRTLV